MAEIQVVCPHCNAEGTLDESYSGRSIKCVTCGHSFIAPTMEGNINANPGFESTSFNNNAQASSVGFSNIVTVVFDAGGTLQITTTSKGSVTITVTRKNAECKNGIERDVKVFEDPESYQALMTGVGIKKVVTRYLPQYEETYGKMVSMSVLSPETQKKDY
ncbi:MAG: zinc ribbon domain-containing protein [Armatimonadota bacterium]